MATFTSAIWASEADRIAYENDIRNYGTGYCMRCPDGLLRRIDPVNVIVDLPDTPNQDQPHD